MIKQKVSSLYIHIPFCRHICPYCDFAKLLKNQNFEDEYITKILKDLSSLQDKFFNFETVYIGGGTPSILSKNNLERLLKKISLIKDKDAEFTIECNPEDINEDLLIILKKYGVNRISIGVQTFNESILDDIGRNYHINFDLMIKLVKKYISNINLDFIYGLPKYTKEILEEDLDKLFKLDVNHASFYSLIVSPGTIYFNDGVKEMDDDKGRAYYDFILKSMREHGFERYEVSNYAKQGYECKHNLTYWHNEEYVGIGLGSSGYVNGVRYSTTRSFKDFLDRKNLYDCEKINSKLLKEYYFITNLRLSTGFSLKEYKKIFKNDFEQEYNIVIKQLIDHNYVKISDGHFSCTDDGLIILDQIILDLLS